MVWTNTERSIQSHKSVTMIVTHQAGLFNAVPGHLLPGVMAQCQALPQHNIAGGAAATVYPCPQRR